MPEAAPAPRGMARRRGGAAARPRASNGMSCLAVGSRPRHECGRRRARELVYHAGSCRLAGSGRSSSAWSPGSLVAAAPRPTFRPLAPSGSLPRCVSSARHPATSPLVLAAARDGPGWSSVERDPARPKADPPRKAGRQLENERTHTYLARAGVPHRARNKGCVAEPSGHGSPGARQAVAGIRTRNRAQSSSRKVHIKPWAKQARAPGRHFGPHTEPSDNNRWQIFQRRRGCGATPDLAYHGAPRRVCGRSHRGCRLRGAGAQVPR